MLSTGRVYKIICALDDTICYVGSTFNELRHRWQQHKQNYLEWVKNNKKQRCSVFPYFQKYGIENFNIVLIKEYQCVRTHNKDHRHLAAYETLWIRNHKKTAVNASLPVNYLRLEKDRIKSRDYARKNPSKVRQCQIRYFAENKEKVRAWKARWQRDNRNKKKIVCECGVELLEANINQHRKTKRHIAIMASE
jgi:hypothetical protein